MYAKKKRETHSAEDRPPPAGLGLLSPWDLHPLFVPAFPRRTLFVTNPQAAVEDAPWTEQPEQVGPWEHLLLIFHPQKFSDLPKKEFRESSPIEASGSGKTGFFKSLFGR